MDVDLSVFLLIGLRALIALAAATIGGIIAMGKDHMNHRVLCGLVSFAAGALLAVTVVDIIPEMSQVLQGHPIVILASLVGGTLIFAAIGKYVYFVCPACAASATEHDGGYVRLGLLLMIAMVIHSTIDGLAISAGQAVTAQVGISPVGLMILFAVSYHKIPEGMALVSVARLAGYTRAKALGITVLIELTTAVGAFAGLFLLHGVSSLWLGITLGLVAGSFLYTVGFALLKEMYAHEKGSIILYIVLGFVSILALGAILQYTGIVPPG